MRHLNAMLGSFHHRSPSSNQAAAVQEAEVAEGALEIDAERAPEGGRAQVAAGRAVGGVKAISKRADGVRASAVAATGERGSVSLCAGHGEVGAAVNVAHAAAERHVEAGPIASPLEAVASTPSPARSHTYCIQPARASARGEPGRSHPDDAIGIEYHRVREPALPSGSQPRSASGEFPR